MAEAMKWKTLLVDPCGSDLAHPCYSGTDAGYLIRTVDSVGISVGGTYTSGSTYGLDAVIEWTPWNVSTTSGIVIGSGAPGAALGLANTGVVNFITNSGAVRGYRPVASCIKWLPTGAIATRAGEIGLGYSPGTIVSTASTPTALACLSLAQYKTTNGQGMHEVNWLPTAFDELFTTPATASQQGCGTVFIVLKGVDAVAGSATVATMSGYVEITTVWEWTPTISNNVTIDPRTPSPFTSQQVLSSFGDIRNAMFGHAATAAAGYLPSISSKLGGMAGAAASMAIDYASRSFMGVSNPPGRMRGRGM